jgi:ComF family protein
MYDGPLQSMLLAGKWSTSSNNIRTLARIYIDVCESQLQSLNVDRILPIPQIWHRRLRRNFNAAEIVANEIGKRLNRPVDLHILRRSRGTKPQKRASFADRTKIQRDSFRIQQKYVIRQERLLLVDDILTTGATCDEAVRTLQQAGANECHVAVLARVPGSAS